MTHIFSNGLDQMRHMTHLARKLDSQERQETVCPTTGFLLVRTGPTTTGNFLWAPANSPSTPRRAILRSST